ncbi:MAG: hypothetical protein GXO76_05260 [Calditrichaeota bacterium]|nr:hypothetical protein [Calditrichota bacterium]
MRIKIKNIQVLAIPLILLLTFATGFSQVKDTVELAYDDGSHSFPISYRVNAYKLVAVRFTPPSDSIQILRARYFIADTTYGTKFQFAIMGEKFDEPTKNIFGPVEITAKQIGWNEYDLESRPIFVRGDFYFVLTLSDSSPTFGGEINQPYGERTYCYCT